MASQHARNSAAGVDALIDEVRKELAGELRARLRDRLAQQSREWLVEALIAQLDAPRLPIEVSAPPNGATSIAAPLAAPPGAVPSSAAPPSMGRLLLDEAGLRAFITRCQALTRDRLEADGYLTSPPCQGATLIDARCRSFKGDLLLSEAKTMLDGLLFGDAACGVGLTRVQRELLTITVARAKAHAIGGLLRAATEIDAEGTWRDPERVSHDDRAPSTVIEVEYGEVASEAVGRGIALALRLINDLEINEQILYARMENIEESSLASPL